MPYQEKEEKIYDGREKINIDPLRREARELAENADLNDNRIIDVYDIKNASTEDLEKYNDFLNENYDKLCILFGKSEVEKINSFVKKELKSRLIDNTPLRIDNFLNKFLLNTERPDIYYPYDK